MAEMNRRILLAARPVGEPRPEDFRIEDVPVSRPGEGQVLARVLWLSLDPYMRGRMSTARSYVKPVELGDVMVGEAVGEVVTSRAEGFGPGDLVRGFLGWQTHAVVEAAPLRKVDPAQGPIQASLGILGMPGMTAWAGMENIGKPRAGETVVVAAAAGPVGSLVGQIAKRRGCRAVGIAGGPDKCRYVVEDLGFDEDVDHRDPAMPDRLAAACPDGIDIYFENVGGAVWDAVLPLLNNFARVPVCGLVANYNLTEPAPGPDRTALTMRAVLTRRLTLRGFIVWDFAAQEDEFRREVGSWVREGSVRYREDVTEGLDNAPAALIGMLRGRNLGKTLVRVAPA